MRNFYKGEKSKVKILFQKNNFRGYIEWNEDKERIDGKVQLEVRDYFSILS